jgi:hypothetical protein
MCDAVLPAAWRTSARCLQRTGTRLSGARQQLLDGVLRRHRIDRETGAQLEAGDLAEARVDLPMPVVRGVDLLAQRRGVRTSLYGGPSRVTARAARTCRSASALAATSRSLDRPKSASWRRGTIQTSNGDREANGAKATVESSCHTSRSARFGSSRTRRHHGHSPSRMTNLAEPPSSSAIRCGIWGRS